MPPLTARRPRLAPRARIAGRRSRCRPATREALSTPLASYIVLWGRLSYCRGEITSATCRGWTSTDRGSASTLTFRVAPRVDRAQCGNTDTNHAPVGSRRVHNRDLDPIHLAEIGRASCRERV